MIDEQKKAPADRPRAKNKNVTAGANNDDETLPSSAQNARENPDYSSNGSRHALPDANAQKLQPYYDSESFCLVADYDSEAALIGCIFLESEPVISAMTSTGIENPVDLLADVRHRIIFRIACDMVKRGSAVDLVSFKAAYKNEVDSGREKPGVVSLGYVSSLMELVPSPGNLPTYLSAVLDKYKARMKRRLLAAQHLLEKENPNNHECMNDSLESLIAELEKIKCVGVQKKKAVHFATWNEVADYEVPDGYMLMENQFLARGQITVVAGYPGTGKSMFTMWLAALAAAGAEEFMGQKILTQFRTLILQNENGLFPLQQRFQGVQSRFPDFDFNDWIKVSEPPESGLAVSDPEFRRLIKSEIRQFNPGLVVIDPFTNLVNDLGHRDYSEALAYIRDIIPERADQPAVLIVAHCRKKANGAKRAKGRALLNEIIGSQVLGGVTRAAWCIDAVSDDVEDERVIVQAAKNNNGKMLGPSAWTRGVGYFDELPDFDMSEYYSEDGGNGSSGNTKDGKAWAILSDISNGDPIGFNRWHEACKAEGIYKGKASFNEAVKRLRQSNRIQQDAASKLYQIVMEDGAFSED